MSKAVRGRLLQVGLAAMVVVGGLLAGSAPVWAQVASRAGAVRQGPDLLVLRDGREMRGTIVEETESTVSIRLLIGGIEALSPTVFNKSDILRIDRGEAAPEAPEAPAAPAGGSQPGTTIGTDPGLQAGVNSVRVYHMRLSGEFAKDISETPILEALEDAARQQAQIIVVEIDNEWQASEFQAKSEDEHAFDEFWRTDKMRPLFTSRLAQLFPRERPRVVMWVKNAMGGAAFLPLLSREIYFAPEGRMGGIGDLDTYFEGIDEWVKDKQQSLRLAAVRGVAIAGGYDPRLIDAMCMGEYVLSVSYESGTPAYYEGLPRPEHNEVLLTDDGEEDNQDTDAEVVRAQGNDNLTLHAELAQKLRVSRGTAASIGDLLFELGVGRNYVMVSDNAKRIMDDWGTGIDEGIRAFLRMRDQELPEAQGAEGGGAWEDRNRARGRQNAIIRDMVRLLNKYGEVLDPEEQIRAQLELQLEAIRLRSIQDQRR